MTHAGQSPTRSAHDRGGHPVSGPDQDVIGTPVDPQVDRLARRMPTGIGQALTHDPAGRQRHRCVRRRRRTRLLEDILDPRLSRATRQLGHPVGGGHIGGSEHIEHRPDLRERPVRGAPDRLDGFGCLLGTHAQSRPRGLGLDGDQGQLVAHDIVQFLRDPGSFRLHRSRLGPDSLLGELASQLRERRVLGAQVTYQATRENRCEYDEHAADCGDRSLRAEECAHHRGRRCRRRRQGHGDPG